jgi:glycerol-3-phosphate dehydrogenase (NAD(P)+)
MRSMDIAVLGAGAFGTALAKILDEKGNAVTLWCRTAEGAVHISSERESQHLPGVKLSERVQITHDLMVAVRGKPMVLGVTPSHAVRDVLRQAGPHLDPDVILVNASKGIEQETLDTIDRIYEAVLPSSIAGRAAFLSGPTFAKELAAGLPAAIVVASHSADSAERAQLALATDTFRVYTTEDVVGVEVGGALKNIMAIGAGIADGLGYGHNTRAALITRGLNEIARVGVRMGANPLTFAGLAGMGDLVLTCTGDLSRNRQVGLELGRGRPIEDIMQAMHSVAEGVKTTHAAYELGRKLAVDTPIVDAIHSVLYDGKPARVAVADLLKREAKQERG